MLGCCVSRAALRCAGVLSVFLSATAAHSGSIVSIGAPVGPGLVGGNTGSGWSFVHGSNGIDNDDYTAASPSDEANSVTINGLTLGALGYVDTTFVVTDTGGTTEYTVFEFQLTNDTGVDWAEYVFELGFGSLEGFSQAGGTGDGLDFDTAGFPTGGDTGGFPEPVFDLIGGTLLTGVSHLEDTLTFSQPDPVTDGSSSSVRFAFDVPNGLDGSFTLRQYPVQVPEPSVATLVAMGLAALSVRRRSVERDAR